MLKFIAGILVGITVGVLVMAILSGRLDERQRRKHSGGDEKCRDGKTT